MKNTTIKVHIEKFKNEETKQKEYVNISFNMMEDYIKWARNYHYAGVYNIKVETIKY